jgi:hypothetical protein
MSRLNNYIWVPIVRIHDNFEQAELSRQVLVLAGWQYLYVNRSVYVFLHKVWGITMLKVESAPAVHNQCRIICPARHVRTQLRRTPWK